MKPKSLYEIGLILAVTLGFIAAISAAGLLFFHRSGVEGAQAAAGVFHGGGWILMALVALGGAAAVLLIFKARGGRRSN